jgi:3-oxoacyl-[acyl-carrier protein] reductase
MKKRNEMDKKTPKTMKQSTGTNRRFDGKVAIVTGAAKGIGKCTAKMMAQEGAVAVIADIDGDVLQKAASDIRKIGEQAKGVRCDVAVRKQVDELVNSTYDEFGRIDILVNNAGVLKTGTIEETTDEIIDETLAVNVKGVLYAIRAVTPIMKSQRYGRIVNVASITGKNGDNTTVFVYGASKGAVISLTRSVARQLGPFGVTCNAVAPHAVMTHLMKYWDEAKKEDIAGRIPVRRLGTEEDISGLICYIASDEAGYINGETVNINGGFYMD